MRFKVASLPIVVLVLFLASGCAIKPKPFTATDASEMGFELNSRIHVQQEPLPEVMSLDEAIARTLKYNLEHRLKVFEVMLKNRQYDLSLYDLLPDVAVKAASEVRSNDDASVSKNLSTGLVSKDYTSSEDRSKQTASAEFSWNVLDLGMSYYTIHQQANRYLIAKEQQRKVVQDIISQTREAFFKALVAQELQDRINTTLQQAEEAFDRARLIESERLRPLEEVLSYQKTLIQTINNLESLQREMIIAKVALAALINIPANTLPRLSPPEWYGSTCTLDISGPNLETYAFTHRPEILQWGYQKRVTALEAKKALLDLVPGVGFNLSTDYSSNSYDLHSSWQQASVHVAYNLMNIIKYPAKAKMLELQKQVEDAQGLSIGMAILVQVNLARQQHEFALQKFSRADQMANVDNRLKELSDRQVQERQGIILDYIHKSVAAISGQLNREQALINYYDALGKLYSALGVDYLDYSALPENLDNLVQIISTTNAKLWKQGDLSTLFQQAAPTTQEDTENQ